MYQAFQNVLLLIGSSVIIYLTYSVLTFLHLHLLHSSSLPKYLHPSRSTSFSTNDKPSSSWALVTGASDGIGRAFASELAHAGFNVILHGRNEAKLVRVKTELQAECRDLTDRQFRIFVADASDRAASSRAVDALAAALSSENLNLTVLVNNVGGAGGVQPEWACLHDRSPEEVNLLIDVNLTFPTQITRALLPLLYRNKPALIMNLGSFSALVATPYMSVYNGSKAYNASWSRSLKAELRAEGREGDIEVLAIRVGKVQSLATRNIPTDVWCPSSRVMAKAALRVVGCGRGDVTPYWGHALQGLSLKVLPERVLEGMVVGIAKTERADELRRL